MLSRDGSWVWDFWTADDGDEFHAFFLHAPTTLGDEGRRHRFARIGHAVSADLTTWRHLASPITTGTAGSFDETATWTGNIVRGDDGIWRMFYTGARFLGAEPDTANIEAIGVATSRDLVHWEKNPSPVVTADPRWYETWPAPGWKEEAWRDPWVFRDPSGVGWHMLVTARANHGDLDDRGVVGYAFSMDLETWEVRPPLTQPGAGFAHLEVLQVELVDEKWVLLFSCPPSALAARNAHRESDVGTWVTVIDDPTAPFDVSNARPLTGAELYSGRLVKDRAHQWRFMTVDTGPPERAFTAGLTDPMAFRIDENGTAHLTAPPERKSPPGR